ncbi:MAG TPA: sigma-54 dependent transcriptional regulator [Gaiellales bacterium]|nr:sigma-54 dependent transcriptional regulator [Gaiellales bacterium]
MASPVVDPERQRGSVRVLIADGAASQRECCLAVLQLGGFDVIACGSSDAAAELLRRDCFDVVIVEEGLQPVGGLAVLQAALATNADARVIITAAAATTQGEEQAMQSGAWYYLPKPFTATHLQLLVGMASHGDDVKPRCATPSHRTPVRLATTRRAMITPIGRAPSFRSALELARRVAPTDIPILITGETGTGKELLAQFIHQHSRRAAGPMVPINCAALPDGLCESELFGHRKGAFTNAVRDKPGLLEIAHRGTLFLDEVLDMPAATQAKLLRVMEDGVVRRVGSEVPDAAVDVRCIAACNADPEGAVRAGHLREDFYYRLNVVRLHLPPLRERLDDIPLLANLFLTNYWRRNRPETPIPKLSEAALAALRGHRWRGNLRELQNAIEWATVSVTPGCDIAPEDLALAQPGVPLVPPDGAGDLLAGTLHDARSRFLRDFESRYVQWVIDRANGDVADAARLARVGRATLHRLMSRCGTEPPPASPAHARRDCSGSRLPVLA